MKRRMNKKGFTLVEVIVVLVILAILAAIMIPSMVKWIDRAQNKSAIVEARTVLLAAQTIASEEYIKNKSATALTTPGDAITLAGVGGSFTTAPTISGGKVTGFEFTTASGKVVTYNATPAAGGDVFTVTP